MIIITIDVIRKVIDFEKVIQIIFLPHFPSPTAHHTHHLPHDTSIIWPDNVLFVHPQVPQDAGHFGKPIKTTDGCIYTPEWSPFVTSLLLESFAGIVNYTFESSDFGPDTPFCGGQSATSKAGYRTLSTCHCKCYAGLCRDFLQRGSNNFHLA